MRSIFTGAKKCGGVRRGNEAKRNDLAERNPNRRIGGLRIQSC